MYVYLSVCSNDISLFLFISAHFLILCFICYSRDDDECYSITSCSFFVLQRSCESDQEDTETKPASLIRRRLSSSSWTSPPSSPASVLGGKRVPGSRSIPRSSPVVHSCLFQSSLHAQFDLYYTDVFWTSVAVHTAATWSEMITRFLRRVFFNFMHRLMCEGFSTHSTVNTLL